MGRHRVGDAAPSSDWIESVLGARHRLSLYHDPAAALADRSALLWMFPTQASVEDYAHRFEAYRNLGTSAALHVVRDVFADFDSYVLRLSDQRVVEHRPMRTDDTLHSDVFIETHESADDTDVFGIRIVFTDTIGALVFTNFATFVGHLEVPEIEVVVEEPVETNGTGFAASS
nr:hypothetical protein [Rhodococcus sp. (in: high G+C Gram-positive bacteria)]